MDVVNGRRKIPYVFGMLKKELHNRNVKNIPIGKYIYTGMHTDKLIIGTHILYLDVYGCKK